MFYVEQEGIYKKENRIYINVPRGTKKFKKDLINKKMFYVEHRIKRKHKYS